MSDFPKEACGVFGAHSSSDVFPLIYWGLISQNHRGHHSHGFLIFDRGFKVHHAMGLLPPVRHPVIQRLLKELRGCTGVGHVRYVKSGTATRQRLRGGAQPFVVSSGRYKIGLAYNGSLINIEQVRSELELGGSPSEVELFARKLLHGLKGSDLTSSILACMRDIEGSFSVVGSDQDGVLFAFRDPLGIKPLCYGTSESEEIFAVSSESVGLDINDLKMRSEVKPGELLMWSKDGLEREQLVKCDRRAFCSFEFAYFARPDSILNGTDPVYKIREAFGRNLAREDPDMAKKVDVIVSIPETGDDATYGLHEETGIPWERALRRHRYVTDRAFITGPKERETIISKKLNVGNAIKGKRVAAVEDSIVRGDTLRRTVRKLREAGAKEVHMYITFPKIISPCFYGIDMATFGELIGARQDAAQIAKILGADSIHYQSIEGFIRATGLRRDELCLGCLTRQYPTPLAQKLADEMWARFEKGEKEVRED